jgi:hypothetical protein
MALRAAGPPAIIGGLASPITKRRKGMQKPSLISREQAEWLKRRAEQIAGKDADAMGLLHSLLNAIAELTAKPGDRILNLPLAEVNLVWIARLRAKQQNWRSIAPTRELAYRVALYDCSNDLELLIAQSFRKEASDDKAQAD